MFYFFFFNDTATTEIYTLSLHDALPICIVVNGLPVMMNRENFGRPPDLTLDKYYEENVIGGAGSFMIVADNFDQFGRAVRTKLVREVSGIDATPRPTPA